MLYTHCYRHETLEGGWRLAIMVHQLTMKLKTIFTCVRLPRV